MKEVLVFKSLYVLLLYLLITKEKNKLFITTSNIDKTILYNLKNKIVIEEPIWKRNYFYNKLLLFFWLKKIKKNIDIIKLKQNFNIKFYGQDNVFIGNIFLRENFQLIEEGIINYNYFFYGNNMSKLKQFMWLYIYKLKPTMGSSHEVKKIYLTGLAPIPEEIKNKVEIINLKELWNNKTKEEKNEILDIFGFDEDIINKIKNKKNILFTQPLSEDRFISEEEKIKLYKKIISNYPEKDLVIKKHPREKTNYKKYFPEIEILNQSFPAELFDLLDIKFETAITIFSTAALNFSKNSKIDFYGTKVHPNLLKRWGDSEKIMKTNKFLNGEPINE